MSPAGQQARATLDDALATFNAQTSYKRFKTGTKMYTAEITDTGKTVFVRAEMQVRVPAEQIVA